MAIFSSFGGFPCRGCDNRPRPAYKYDAAGNLLMDNLNCYTYDAENRLSSVAQETSPGSDVCGATVMSYLYGPDGRRVAKVNNGQIVKQFYYDAAGQEIAEANAAGALQRAEIFAGGRHLATWTNSGGGATYFNHADWLGTERARSNSAGTLCETITSLPFGDGQATTPQNGGCATADPSPNHFTGKERDTESGLDNFGSRYYGSNMGRWMSPDWSEEPTPVPYSNLGDPQSLNLYGYVRNNPMSNVDADGHDCPVCPDIEELAQDAHEVARVVGPLVASAGTAVTATVTTAVIAPIALAGSVGLAIQSEASKTQSEADLKMQEAGAANDVALRKQQQKQQQQEEQQTSPPSPQNAEHTKNPSPSKWDDHTKKRPGTSPPPNYKPDRKFKQPKDDKKKDKEKPPYRRKDCD